MWVTLPDDLETPLPANDTTGPVRPIQFKRANSIAEPPPKTVQPADCRQFLGPPYLESALRSRQRGGARMKRAYKKPVLKRLGLLRRITRQTCNGNFTNGNGNHNCD